MRVISDSISGVQLQRTPKLGSGAQLRIPRSSCSLCPSERLLKLPDGNKSLQNGAGEGVTTTTTTKNPSIHKVLKSGSKEIFCSTSLPAHSLASDAQPPHLPFSHPVTLPPPAIEKRKTKVNFPRPTQIFLAGVAGIQAAEPGGDGVCSKSLSPSAPGTRLGVWAALSQTQSGDRRWHSCKKPGAPPGQPWGQ